MPPVPTITIEPSQTPTFTVTPIPATPTLTQAPTAAPTQPPPQQFRRTELRDEVQEVQYIKDACEYYKDRWDENNAKPWTVVVPVMFHGVRKQGAEVQDNMTVTYDYFNQSMQHAHQLGFETITMQQLIDFLKHNAPIPERSLLLIMDDRRLGTFNQHFLPYLQEFHWTMSFSYITGVANEYEWSQIKAALETGHAELQAHGFLHNGQTYVTEFTPEETIRDEIQKPIAVFEEHGVPRPIAFIWPGGNYNEFSVKTAQQSGYELGFTVHSRGPIMFNSIPQGDQEMAIGIPFLTLPRFWSTAMYVDLDRAAELGQKAQEYAEGHKDQELEWLKNNCSN